MFSKGTENEDQDVSKMESSVVPCTQVSPMTSKDKLADCVGGSFHFPPQFPSWLPGPFVPSLK